MATTERVTVTLPVELVERIDRLEPNRSRFIADAVERELVRRRRAGLLRSLESPHPEAEELAETRLAEWGASLPADDEQLVDLQAGTAVRWVEGQVVPVTGTPGEGALYPELSPGESGLTKRPHALIDHLRSIDKRRVRRVFGRVTKAEIAAVDQGLEQFSVPWPSRSGWGAPPTSDGAPIG